MRGPFLAALAWLALALATIPAGADVIFPPGLRIGLQPPPGMTLNKATGRFEDAGRGASLTILDLPGQLYGTMERAIVAELEKPGVARESRQSFPFNGGIGIVVVARLAVDGVDTKKWIFLAASASNPAADLVTVISVQIPKRSLDAYPDAAIRAALASVTFRPPPIEERLALLPFKLDDLAGFHVTNVTPMGVMLRNGPDDLRGRPEIAVTISPGRPRTPEDRATLARQAIMATSLRDLTITGSEPLRIGGSPGYEIRATAKGTDGSAVTIIQWLRFFGGGYLRIFAGARSEDWEQFYPRFRALRDGSVPR